MKIPIKYNPLGNDYNTSGGAIYGSKGCFLFRGSLCIQSNMVMTSKELFNGTGKINRLEVYDSGLCQSAAVAGGTFRVYGGTATETDVLAGGIMLVASGGLADGVSIPNNASVSAGQGGTIRHAQFIQNNATLRSFQGTIADTTVGISGQIYGTSALISNVTLMAKGVVNLNAGTAVNLTLNNDNASCIMSRATASNLHLSSGYLNLENGSASGIELCSGAIFGYGSANTVSVEALDVKYGGKVQARMSTGNVVIRGTCPYGSMLITSGLISGGLYQIISAANGARISNAHIYASGSLSAINKTVVDGLTIHGGISNNSSGFIVSGLTTVGNITMMDAGATCGFYAWARSTMSNIRFSNTSEQNYAILGGDGTYIDVSAGAHTSVYANVGFGGRLAGFSIASGNLSATMNGTMSDLTIDTGNAYVGMYGTATNISVGTGNIIVQEAETTGLKTENGTITYNTCTITDGITGGGPSCGVVLMECQLSAVSFDSCGWVRFAGGTAYGLQLNSGANYGASFCTHEAIVVSSGAVYELTNSAYASTVHVLAGGSLKCVNDAECWACTSDAGAIVTGSNIHYV